MQTAVSFCLGRDFSPRRAGEFAQALEASGAVDYFSAWDQLTGQWPRALWRPENTPLASAMGDFDSWVDPTVLVSFALAATSRLGATISADSVRQGPAELWQKMLSLGSASEGRAVLMLGIGEAKQLKPFGYRREGLGRLEEMLQLFELLWSCDEPFDFEGRYWNYQRAWIGNGGAHRPKVWIMGGGPRVLDLAARYADGILSLVPYVYSTPEQWAEQVIAMRRALEDYGRDPDTFEFGLAPIMFLHEDRTVFERAYDNPLVRFQAATFGRLRQSDWISEGVEPVLPLDWHYAVDLLPTWMTPEETEAIVAAVPRAMIERSHLWGDPREVARELQAYVDAGATFLCPWDLMPLLLPLEEVEPAFFRTIELCRALKKQ